MNRDCFRCYYYWVTMPSQMAKLFKIKQNYAIKCIFMQSNFCLLQKGKLCVTSKKIPDYDYSRFSTLPSDIRRPQCVHLVF